METTTSFARGEEQVCLFHLVNAAGFPIGYIVPDLLLDKEGHNLSEVGESTMVSYLMADKIIR